MNDKPLLIGVIGAGTMGRGIAQIAAQNGHDVILCDNDNVLFSAKEAINKSLHNLVEKGKMTPLIGNEIHNRISFYEKLDSLSHCDFIIEAIVENLDIKRNVFTTIEKIVKPECILATNTSSLSIASIAGAFTFPERFIGVHFFNPATIMPLVEIVPSFITTTDTVNIVRKMINGWNKVTVLAKDTPGFIVNRIARPFYGESIRIFEEGIADVSTIDWALKEIGGFKMVPFELMDYIGHDVNYVVTEAVFAQFYYDSRFKPSIVQKRLLEAGCLGRKTGRGFYDYREGATNPEPKKDKVLGSEIVNRVLIMLINEAYDALSLKIANKEDIELSMTKGVNYPKGLLAWADEIGIKKVYEKLKALQDRYGEDRYRPNFLLKEMAEK